MITGIWLSPEGDQVAIQFDEEEINIESSGGSRAAGEIPEDWRTIWEAN